MYLEELKPNQTRSPMFPPQMNRIGIKSLEPGNCPASCSFNLNPEYWQSALRISKKHVCDVRAMPG